MSGIFRRKSRTPYIWVATKKRFPRTSAVTETPPVYQQGEGFLDYAGSGETTAPVPVPTGVAAEDVIVVRILREYTGTPTHPALSGWVEKSYVAVTQTTGTILDQTVLWKRASGADTGTYTFTWTGGTHRTASSHRFTGVATSGDPFDNFDQEASATDSANAPITTFNTTSTNTLLLWLGGGYAGNSVWTPPSGFTEQDEHPNHSAATLVQSATGSTGSVGGSGSSADKKIVFLGAIKPVSVVSGDTVSPSGIVSGQAFGTTVIVREPYVISPGGITSAQAFGTALIIHAIKPTGITSAEAFGTAKTIRNIVLSGIASVQAFGTAVVTSGQAILPTGIGSAQAFGAATVIPGAATIQPSGIASAQGFGTANLVRTIFPSSIPTAQAFGIPKLTLTIFPIGIASAQAFGTAVLSRVLQPTGIASLQAFGTAILSVVQEGVPDAILAVTNLSGVLADIQDDPKNPDSNWLTADNPQGATSVRVSFPTPSTAPGSGGPKMFQVRARRTDNAGANPNAVIELWESGSFVKTLTTVAITVTGDSGQLITGMLDPADLSDASGAGVELKVNGVPV